MAWRDKACGVGKRCIAWKIALSRVFERVCRIGDESTDSNNSGFTSGGADKDVRGLVLVRCGPEGDLTGEEDSPPDWNILSSTQPDSGVPGPNWVSTTHQFPLDCGLK